MEVQRMNELSQPKERNSVEIKVTRRMRWCMTPAAAPVDCGIGAGEREMKGKKIPRQRSAMADLNDDGQRHLRAACCPHG
jgi:hypothetical protein